MVIGLDKIMSYIIVAILSCLLVYASIESERHATDRRVARLVTRQPVLIDEWTQSVPSIDRKTIETILPMIGTGLRIPHQYLWPTDSFHVELNLKDRFWCLIVDDDSQESIADVFDDRFNRRPSSEWENLRDVIVEVASIATENDG